MRKQLIIILCNVAVLAVSVLIFPGITCNSVSAVAGMGLILWIVNLILKPVLLLVTLPLNVISLGIMGLIVNTWTLRISAGLTKGFAYPNFWTAFFTALMLTAVHIFFINRKDITRGNRSFVR